MKTLLCLLLFFLAASLARAQTNLTGLLQQGMFEEEANHNLPAAMVNYQELANQFDKDRQLAATAIFRLGECCREEGDTNNAAREYQRIIREFPDQQSLVTLSCQDLAGMGIETSQVAMPNNSGANLWNEVKDLPESELVAVLPTLAPDPVLISLLQQRDLAQAKLEDLKTYHGPDSPEIRAEKEVLLVITKRISDKIGGIMEALKIQAQAAAPLNTEEDQEIQRIQAMLQNSPDLINAPDDHGHTPLENAAINGWLKVAAFLLDHGADVNAGKFSALNLAANAGNRAMVEFLLNHGADIHTKAWTGETPLHTAASEGYQAVTEALIANKAGLNAQDDYGDTPLLEAARNGHQDVVQILLKARADPNLADKDGRTPLSWAADAGSPETVKALLVAKADPNAGTIDAPLLCAVDKQDLASAELLLQAGANPNVDGLMHCSQGAYGSRFYHEYNDILRTATPLWLVIQEHQLPMVQLLLKYKANPDAQISEPPSVIFWALSDTNILEALLDADANVVNIMDDGRTPLNEAAKKDLLDSVKLLLAAGAPPNTTDNDSRSPLSWAADVGRVEMVKALLAAKAEPNFNTSYAPLVCAVYKNDPEKVKILLQAGADPNVAALAPAWGWNGSPILFKALENTNILEELLDAGANPNVHEEVERGDWSPLARAIYRDDVPTIQILLRHGANPNPASARGDFPLHDAVSQFDPAIFQALLDHGADPNRKGPDGRTPLKVLEDVASGKPNLGFLPSSRQSTLAVSIADLLRRHGALEVLPDWDHITVSTPWGGDSATPFSNEKDWNQFTLLETILKYFQPSSGPLNYQWYGANGETGSPMSFPDLSRVTIVRPRPGTTNVTGMKINLLNRDGKIDCSKDVPLKFGDTVQISQREHILSESDTNLPAWLAQISSCLQDKAGSVKLIVDGGQTVQIGLGRFGPSGASIGKILFSSQAQNVLTSDSDLSHLKVTRKTKGAKTAEWTLDCADLSTGQIGMISFGDGSQVKINGCPDFWLRDGDVIEVPQKP